MHAAWDGPIRRAGSVRFGSRQLYKHSLRIDKTARLCLARPKRFNHLVGFAVVWALRELDFLCGNLFTTEGLPPSPPSECGRIAQ